MVPENPNFILNNSHAFDCNELKCPEFSLQITVVFIADIFS